MGGEIKSHILTSPERVLLISVSELPLYVTPLMKGNTSPSPGTIPGVPVKETPTIRAAFEPAPTVCGQDRVVGQLRLQLPLEVESKVITETPALALGRARENSKPIVARNIRYPYTLEVRNGLAIGAFTVSGQDGLRI